MTIPSAFRRLALAGLALGASAATTIAQDTKKVAPPNPVAAPAPASGAQAQPPGPTNATVFDAAQIVAIKKVNDYFNGLANLKCVFQQTNPDGKKLRGKLAMKRPGRFRFDYNLPSKQVVISDGRQLAIQDNDIKTDDRYELDNTPFRMLLRKDVDLMRDAQILEVAVADDLIILSIQDKSPDAPGKIKLFLSSKPSVELKEWVTTDAQNLETRVELSSMNRTDDVDAALFEVKSNNLGKFQQ